MLIRSLGKRRKKARSFKKRLFFVFIFIIFSFFFVINPVLKIKAKAEEVKTRAGELKEVLAKNDIDLLDRKFKKFSQTYRDFETEAKAIYWMRYIPIIGGYTRDFKNGVEAGRFLIEAGKVSIKAIRPHADLIGFKKGGSGFVEKSAEDRLQTAILTLDRLLPEIDEIAKNISLVKDRIKMIDLNRYPKRLGKIEVRSKVKNLKEQVEGIASLFVDVKPLLKKLPLIFGKDEEKTYLLLFQNDKELRATGGFLTAYALFKAERGKLKIERSEDIYSLDDSISRHPKAPREILTYHKNVNRFNIRDSNLSPDFVESINLFQSLYEKSSKKIDYDGIIALDSYVLVDMLKIFGDTAADGIVFSAKTDKRCDCPQVVYKLFDIIDRPTPYLRQNRKGILGDLMFALFYKAIGFSPSKYWGRLAQTMFKNLKEKHILLYFRDREIQRSIERLNFAGRIRDFSPDYLHINDVNFAGAKSNMFVSHFITSKTIIRSEGSIDRRLVIEYKNPHPHSNCSLEKGGLCLNATLRNWIRIYVPKGSKLVSFKGSEKKVRVYEELGKTVFEGFLRVSPKGKATVIVGYKLPIKVKDKKEYKLMIQKQPGTAGHSLKVYVDNKKVYGGRLDTDKIIKNK